MPVVLEEPVNPHHLREEVRRRLEGPTPIHHHLLGFAEEVVEGAELEEWWYSVWRKRKRW